VYPLVYNIILIIQLRNISSVYFKNFPQPRSKKVGIKILNNLSLQKNLHKKKMAAYLFMQLENQDGGFYNVKIEK